MAHVQRLEPSRLSQLTPAQLTQHLHLQAGPDGLPSEVGIADLVRSAAARWGPCRRRDLTAYIYRHLDACDLTSLDASARVREVVEALVTLRELEEIRSDALPLLAPGILRLVRCGDEIGFLTGCLSSPGAPTAALPRPGQRAMLTRWIQSQQAIAKASLPEWSPREWLGVPDFLVHLRRRGASGPHLPKLWAGLQADFQEFSAPISEPQHYRVICGSPGEFFGILHEERWGRLRPAAGAPDGLWCGVSQSGFHERSFLPELVEISGGAPARALRLFDKDELCWALLARGLLLNQPELLLRDSAIIKQSCWLPRQLRSLLKVTCRRTGWSWQTWPEAAESIHRSLLDGWGLAG